MGGEPCRLDGISVVVPVFNSETTLDELTTRLAAVLPVISVAYEVILVNDGSRDRSWDAIVHLSQRHPWVRGVRLLRNYGQHNALLCGIRSARYDVIATMDDDLQNPPEELPKLLDRLQSGVQVVYGTPASRTHGLWRTVASKVTRIALSVAMGADRARKVSAFRVFRTEVRDAFANYQGPLVSVDVLLTWGSEPFASVAVESQPRAVGRSNYSFWQLVTVALNMATGFSVLPLRLASIVGFVFTVFGFGVLVFVLMRYIVMGGSVPGFPFLASIVAILSGAQLFALGIIGEYLGRTYMRTMNRPPYVVGSVTPDDARVRQVEKQPGLHA